MVTLPEYNSWFHMIQRCTNPKNKAWRNYGGRGIKVCERWRLGFFDFIEDVGRKPSVGLTLERINNEGHYEPGNVRWATKSEQSRNRRKYKCRKLRSRCKNGHPFDDSNTYKLKNGWRVCLTCKRAFGLASDRKRRAATRELRKDKP